MASENMDAENIDVVLAKEAIVQRAHRAFGRAVVKRPVFVWAVSFLLFMVVQLGWIPAVREGLGVKLGKGFAKALTDKDFEELWSTDAGDVPVDETVRKWKTLRNRDWEHSLQLTMFVGKGPLKGQDIITPEVFDEASPLLKKFHALKVNVNGKTYTTWDLCVRGAIPDKPRNPQACKLWEANKTNLQLATACLPAGAIGGLPYMPCMISAPQACFSEYAEDALHPSYKVLDPIIGQMPALAAQVPLPWTGPAGRPSYRTLGAEGMKKEVSKERKLPGSPVGQRGCNGWSGLMTFTPETWGGGVEWNAAKTELQKVPATMWTLFIDAPARIAFRISCGAGLCTTPTDEKVNEVAQAIDQFQDAWQREVEHFSKQSSIVEVVNMQWPSTFEEIAEQYEESPAWMIALGYVMMSFFVFCSLFSLEAPLRGRWLAGLMGLVAVGSAAAGGTSLYMLFGGQLNALMLVVLPFFALGVGVNDMFVFMGHYSEFAMKADVSDESRTENIICKTLAHAGPGAFITSFCNCVIFACGATMLPVPALADFCANAAVVTLANYVAILTQVVPFLVLASRRTSSAASSRSSLQGIADAWKARTQCFSVAKVQARVNRMSPRIYGGLSLSCVFCALVLLAVSAVLIENKDIGYDAAEVVKEDSPQHRQVEVFFDEFNSFPAFLCFDGVDVPQKQQQMLELFSAVTSQKHSQPGFVPNYLTAFYLYLQMTGQSSAFDPTWRMADPMLAPFGVVGNNASFYNLYHAWSKVPLENPALAWSPINQGFLTADLSYTNEFSYSAANRSLSPSIEYSFFPFYIVDLRSNKDVVKSIKDVNDQLKKSSLKGQVSVYGPTFTFWSVLVDLEKEGARMTVIIMCAVFFCTLICSLASSSKLASALSADVTGYRKALVEVLSCISLALISTLACVMIVTEIYGLSMLFAKYNQFVAMALLAAAGMSVEFVAHLVASFLSNTGSPQERVTQAWGLVTPAVIQGTLSTILGLIPMLGSPFVFVIKYCFGMFAMVQVIGLLNGAIFLPGFLSLAGFVCYPSTKVDTPVDASSNSGPVGKDLPAVLGSDATEKRSASASAAQV